MSQSTLPEVPCAMFQSPLPEVPCDAGDTPLAIVGEVLIPSLVIVIFVAILSLAVVLISKFCCCRRDQLQTRTPLLTHQCHHPRIVVKKAYGILDGLKNELMHDCVIRA